MIILSSLTLQILHILIYLVWGCMMVYAVFGMDE